MIDLEQVKQRALEIQQYHLYVGVPPDNKQLNMIALVQEYGKHIEHKNYPYLVIPVTDKYKHTYEVPHAVYKRGMSLGINDPSQPNGYKMLFILKESIDIPARPFVRFTFDNSKLRWSNLYSQKVRQCLVDTISVQELMQVLGDNIKNDLKETIAEMSHPSNAPLTAERKGFDNPLIDTKTLYNSITVIAQKE